LIYKTCYSFADPENPCVDGSIPPLATTPISSMEKCPETGILYAAQIEIRVQFIAHDTRSLGNSAGPSSIRPRIQKARAGRSKLRSPRCLSLFYF
jgi:hypothetical protein